MAGVYGKIDSRADFHLVLGEATRLTESILSKSPKYAVMQVIQRQLQAMKRWTDNGREPTEKERTSVDVGLIAVRELGDSDGEPYELSEKLMELNNYFEDWPSDEDAAKGEDDDDEEN